MFQIPKGTQLVRCGQVSSMSSKHFKSPDKFIPERWIRGDPDRHTANQYAYLPFGHGARYKYHRIYSLTNIIFVTLSILISWCRSCIGERFARLEMQVLLVKIIQNYKLTNLSGDVGTITRSTAAPDRPVVIGFEKRK